MDNTLTDELGATVRPGIVALLKRLRSDGHTLLIWTHSNRERARDILKSHSLAGYFTTCICRENYDPDNHGNMKDIRKIKGDFLVDDDPSEVKYVRSLRRDGFVISPYRKGANFNTKELDEMYRRINRSGSLLSRIFR